MANVGAELRDVAAGLWIWRIQHPAWQEGFDWEPLVTSTVVESGNEVAVIDPLAPPRDVSEIWDRLDAKLELPFEHVIVSHGVPVHDRHAYEMALDRPPWSG